MTSLTLRWWSLSNWLKGYQFRPIQRFRCCNHTTPYHYRWCQQHPLHFSEKDGAGG